MGPDCHQQPQKVDLEANLSPTPNHKIPSLWIRPISEEVLVSTQHSYPSPVRSPLPYPGKCVKLGNRKNLLPIRWQMYLQKKTPHQPLQKTQPSQTPIQLHLLHNQTARLAAPAHQIHILFARCQQVCCIIESIAIGIASTYCIVISLTPARRARRIEYNRYFDSACRVCA